MSNCRHNTSRKTHILKDVETHNTREFITLDYCGECGITLKYIYVDKEYGIDIYEEIPIEGRDLTHALDRLFYNDRPRTHYFER